MTTFHLSGTVSIRTADEERERLRQALAGAERELAIEFDEDLVADATLVQLVAASRLSAAGADKTISLHYRPGGRFAGMLETFGLRPPAGRSWGESYDVFWADEAEVA